MAATDSQRTRIQRFLIDLAQAGVFYSVEYDATTKKPNEVVPGVSPTIQAKAIHANETGGMFSVDKNMKREYRLQRTRWSFDLELGFDGEALLDAFLDSFKKPPVLQADEGFPPVMLMLESYQANHPTQTRASGTVAVLHFTGTEGRETRPQ